MKEQNMTEAMFIADKIANFADGMIFLGMLGAILFFFYKVLTH